MATRRLVVELSADITQFVRRMNEATSSIREVGKKMEEHGRTIGQSLGAAGLVVAGGLGIAVKKAADFEAQMSRVGAIAGASKGELDDMKDAAIDLGAKTSKSATEVAKGMENMAAMGYNANQIIAAMPGIIAAAEASGEDMALVTDVVAAALNGFSLEAGEASHVADVLAAAANNSAAGVGDMQYSFKYAAPLFKAAGYSMETLAAATGELADSGMEGSQSGTTLRSAILSLSKPSDAASTAIGELGIKVRDSHNNLLPLPNILDQFKKKLSGMGNAQKLAALATVFGTEAASGMLTLIDKGGTQLQTLTTKYEKSSGQASETAKKMKDNLNGVLDNLTGSFESAQISIGTALLPAIRKVAESVSGLIDKFNSLSPQTKSFIAIGLVVTAGLLLLGSAVGFLVMGLGMLAAAEWAALAPILLIVVGIVALIAIFVLAYAKCEWFRNIVQTAFTYIKDLIMKVIGAVVSFVSSQLAFLQTWWKAHSEGIMIIVKAAWSVISSVIKIAMNIIMFVIKQVWGSIKGVIAGALKIITSIIGIFADIVTGNWSQLWTDIKTLFVGVVQFVWNFINLMFWGKILMIFKNFGMMAINLLKGSWTSIMGGVKAFGTGLLNTFKGMWNGSINSVQGFISILKQVFSAVKNIIVKPFEGAFNVVKSVFSKIKSLFRLPTISMAMKKGALGIPMPSFSVNWHKDGGVFNNDSIVGLGEAGPEAVVPLQGSRMKPFAQAIASQMPQNDKGGFSGEIIVPVHLDGREIARVTASHMDSELRRKRDSKHRSGGRF